MSTFLFPSHRRPAVLALTLCQIAVLSACGGGSDDEAPLASVSSAAIDACWNDQRRARSSIG